MLSGTAGSQLGIGQLLREQHTERVADASLRQQRLDRRRAKDAAEEALAMTSAARTEAVRTLEAAACDYLRLIEVDAEFQSARMMEWMDRFKRWPWELDRRAAGGIIGRMRRAGYIESTGETKNNAGISTTNTNGSPRTIWRVVRVPEGDEL